jgi:hypothetical protein
MLGVEIYDEVLVLLGKLFISSLGCSNQGNDSKNVDAGH